MSDKTAQPTNTNTTKQALDLAGILAKQGINLDTATTKRTTKHYTKPTAELSKSGDINIYGITAEQKAALHNAIYSLSPTGKFYATTGTKAEIQAIRKTQGRGIQLANGDTLRTTTTGQDTRPALDCKSESGLLAKTYGDRFSDLFQKTATGQVLPFSLKVEMSREQDGRKDWTFSGQIDGLDDQADDQEQADDQATADSQE